MSENNFHDNCEALVEAVRNAYSNGQDDYTMEPICLYRDGAPIGLVEDGSTIISALRRGEREVEITNLFTNPGIGPERKIPKNLSYSILTLYNSKFSSLPVAFPPIKVAHTLAETLSKAGRTQLHAAESEKFAHVTFFFNGGECDPFPGEEDLMVPSPKGVRPETFPALSLDELTDKVIGKLGERDFTVVNFANGDVIGHTACDEAKIEACGHVDRNLKRLVEAAREKGIFTLITADHGNIECLRTEAGTPHVAHTSSTVAFMALDMEHDEMLQPKAGSLGDVAPTILSLMDVPTPHDMTGNSLLPNVDGSAERKVILIILDGWGIGDGDKWDAIRIAETPYWDFLMAHPHSELHASGRYVGLAETKPGNSEAGHMNLGAGRCVLQDDVRVDEAVRNGDFSRNPVLAAACERAREKGKPLHILALLSERSSHGSIEYAKEICRMAVCVPEVYLHLILDGRSTAPGSAPELIEKLERDLDKIGKGTIAGCVGRGIILDRDKNYTLVMKAYLSLTEGKGLKAGE